MGAPPCFYIYIYIPYFPVVSEFLLIVNMTIVPGITFLYNTSKKSLSFVIRPRHPEVCGKSRMAQIKL